MTVLGEGLGSVIGGQIFEFCGAVVTFRCCSGLAVVLLLFYIAVQCIVGQRKSKEKPGGEENGAFNWVFKAFSFRAEHIVYKINNILQTIYSNENFL